LDVYIILNKRNEGQQASVRSRIFLILAVPFFSPRLRFSKGALSWLFLVQEVGWEEEGIGEWTLKT
jgi:hypothetical protein